MALKDTTITTIDWVGKILLVVAALGALIGMAYIVARFDDFGPAAQHLRGIRVAVGLLLISVGLTSAIGGIMVKTTTTSDPVRSNGVPIDLGALLDRAGGLGLALVVIGALMLGLSFNADDDHDKGVVVVEGAPAASQ